MNRPAAVPTAAQPAAVDAADDAVEHPVDRAETEAAEAMARRHPHLAERYAQCLPTARAMVLGRLCGAVWRESLPGLTDRREDPAHRLATLVRDDGVRLVAPVTATDVFGHYPAGLAVHLHDPAGQVRALRHPGELLAALRLPDLGGRVSRLRDELADSVANLAMALVAGQRRRARPTGPDSGDPLVYFEQAVTAGHPLHPCCRTRSPLTATDVLDCAPEWNPVVSLPVLAVRRDQFTGRGDLTRLLGAEHPEVFQVARATLPDPDRYALLPVHPWQLRQVLLPRYAEAVASGVLRVLPGVSIDAHPLMSLRTVAPVGPTPRCHLKTAVDAQMTSAVRTVSPAAVHNGPTMSVLLAEISRREGHWGGRFAVLAEPASGCYVDAEHGPSPSLAAVAREPVAAHSSAGDLPLPAAALAARSPDGDHPVIAWALRWAGADPVRWLDRYCQLALPPLLTLLTRWGVALEAHGQNTLVVLRQGWPTAVFYRDFGGVRVSPSRLARHGLTPPLRGDLPADDPHELRAKLTGSLISTHLADVVAVLADWTGTARDVLWGVVAAVCRQVYADLAGEPDAVDDRRALFGDTLPVKAMLSMRLAAEATADRWAWLSNPLAGAR